MQAEVPPPIRSHPELQLQLPLDDMEKQKYLITAAGVDYWGGWLGRIKVYMTWDVTWDSFVLKVRYGDYLNGDYLISPTV